MTYWREEPLEVDAVIEGSWGSWVVQVATGSVSSSDLRGLGEFTRRNPSFRPLVLCAPDRRSSVERAGLSAMSWSEFLLGGPPRTGGSDAR